MRINIGWQIVLLVTISILLSCFAVLFTVTRLMDEPMTEAIDRSMFMAQKTIAKEVKLTIQTYKEELEMVASEHTLIDAVALENQELCATIAKKLLQVTGTGSVYITNSSGNVIASVGEITHNPGENISAYREVSEALRGIDFSGIIATSKIPISIRAAVPIKNRTGEIIGVVAMGLSLGQESFVDGLKETTGLEVTVFKDDERLMTTLMKDGNRIIGTKLNNLPISQAVLQKGETVNGDANILDKPFRTIYWPLQDSDKNTIGMFLWGNQPK